MNDASPMTSLADPGLLKTDALIDGAWVPAQDVNARFAVNDPATGLELARVANLGPVDCAAAISAAVNFTGAGRLPRNCA